jgi:hypothetical protein
VGLIAYGFGIWRYAQLYRARRRPLPFAILIALVLLSEAMFAVAFARNWRTTWWEWHLLMLVAFGLVALAARREWRLEGSSAEIFSDIYEEQTRGHLEEVSVLFADLQGYTAFSERTPEPEIKAMLDTYFPAAAAVLQAHGGELYNTIGDALMVVFRGPDHELAPAARPRVPAGDDADRRRAPRLAALPRRDQLGRGRPRRHRRAREGAATRRQATPSTSRRDSKARPAPARWSSRRRPTRPGSRPTSRSSSPSA